LQGSAQHTLREALVIEGVGLHTGAEVRVRVLPQGPDSGLRFHLVGPDIVFPAHAEFVIETRRATVVGVGVHRVSTVEHLLSGLFAMGVDNALIEVDGPEIPVADGSAGTFVREIARVGLVEQPVSRVIHRVTAPWRFSADDALLAIFPSDRFRVRFIVDYPSPVGAQYFDGDIEPERYFEEIASARTFGYLREVQALLDSGLARGGSLDNALVFDETGPMTPLRWPNEVVRHKVLDLVGDFSLLGAWPQCEVVSIKSGHKLHVQAMRALRAGQVQKAVIR
jgi:UDP-3-O-[3-hydroxymyristoyl] N-acetylglucosamine deacetylase